MLGSFHYYGSSLVPLPAPFSTHPRILNLKGLLWTQFTCGWTLSGAGTLPGVEFQRCTSRLLDLSELQFPGLLSDFYSTGSWEYLKDIVSVQGPALGKHSVNLWPHREPGAKSFIVDQLLLRSMQQSSHHAHPREPPGPGRQWSCAVSQEAKGDHTDLCRGEALLWASCPVGDMK